MSTPDPWLDVIEKLDREYPFIPHTHAGRLSSTVRRMKAEKELGLPIDRRSGFAISTATSHRASEMSEQEWETFYAALSKELKMVYPELYAGVFAPTPTTRGSGL